MSLFAEGMSDNALQVFAGKFGATRFRDKKHKIEFEDSCQMIFPDVSLDRIWVEQPVFAAGHTLKATNLSLADFCLVPISSLCRLLCAPPGYR